MINILQNQLYYYITTSNEFQTYTYNEYDYHRPIASFQINNESKYHHITSS